MWDLPGLGLEPVSPALPGGFLTTAPPGKPNSGTSSAPTLRLETQGWLMAPAPAPARSLLQPLFLAANVHSDCGEEGENGLHKGHIVTFYNAIYLFIWLRRVLVVARRIFSCSMRDLVP